MKSQLLPMAALVAALLRWWLQGSANLYTAVEKRFYVPDPDLGWRVSAAHPVWLGLDLCAVIAVLVVAVYILRRRESRALRAAAWLLGVVAVVAPLAAYASGSRPAGARDALPIESATVSAINGFAGGVVAPVGRYEVIPHDGSSISAHLSAGGESFDARFSGDLRGFWDGNPHALGEPMSADISVAAAAVDTGVRARSKHAREYLKVDVYPRIEVTLDRVLAAQPAGVNRVMFNARGTLTLLGQAHAIAIAGTLQAADAAALARLGLTGDILIVKATFSIAIKETALAAKASDFAGDDIPITVSLVLRHTSSSPEKSGH